MLQNAANRPHPWWNTQCCSPNEKASNVLLILVVEKIWISFHNMKHLRGHTNTDPFGKPLCKCNPHEENPQTGYTANNQPSPSSTQKRLSQALRKKFTVCSFFGYWNRFISTQCIDFANETKRLISWEGALSKIFEIGFYCISCDTDESTPRIWYASLFAKTPWQVLTISSEFKFKPVLVCIKVLILDRKLAFNRSNSHLPFRSVPLTFRMLLRLLFLQGVAENPKLAFPFPLKSWAPLSPLLLMRRNDLQSLFHDILLPYSMRNFMYKYCINTV